MSTATTLLVWGTLAHLIADWPLQTEWMVQNKSNLRHPAAWVHGGVHVLALCFVLPWSLALLTGLIHVLIDTRKPVIWWKYLVGKTAVGPQTMVVEMAVDQVFHVVTLAVVIGIFSVWTLMCCVHNQG